MTISPLDVRCGAQRPRVHSVPDWVSSAGSEAVDLAASAGLVLDEWQRWVLEQALGERSDGQWAAFQVALIVPRQNGKGSILEALELACLFLFGDRLILHSAHEFKTAREAFLRICSLVEDADHLRKRCKKPRTSHGEEGIELLNGNRLNFVARSTGSGRGFSGDKIILDEAFKLSAEAVGAMLPTMSARPNPQVWYTSSAGKVDSTQLRSIRERALSGEARRLCYLEWSAPPEARGDPSNPEWWYEANPALGIRIPEEFVAGEVEAMPVEEFVRERLGIFDTETADAVIPESAWRACQALPAPLSGPYAFGYDVSLDHSWGSISVACRVGDRTHVELVDHGPGTDWIPTRLSQLVAEWSPVATVANPAGPGGALLPRIEAAGLEPVTVSGQEYGQACGMFLEDVLTGRLRHLDDPLLAAAVSGAGKRPLGDAWAWSQRHSTADVTPLTSGTLALWGLYQTPDEKPVFAY